jgi:hypothetical protein
LAQFCFQNRSTMRPAMLKQFSKPRLLEFAWFKDFPAALAELAGLSMHESWDYQQRPTGKLPILTNYLLHTFKKLLEESKVLVEGEYSVFDTGLVTENQEEIYGLFAKNRHPASTIKWFFIGWKKKSARDLTRFTALPDVANYFQDPSDLIFDNRIELRPNIDHIIKDNIARFPASVRAMRTHMIATVLQGTIDNAKKRVRRNYKTAIPQYYCNKIQLLLPLCIQSNTKADLALVVEKEHGIYRASTCLTLDMAINNARLIARPDDEWLIP